MTSVTATHIFASSSDLPKGAEKFFLDMAGGKVASRLPGATWFGLVQRWWRLVVDALLYGPFCALQMFRLSQWRYPLGQSLVLHRTLGCPFFLRSPALLPHLSVVVHNLEFVYYLEEARAESRLLRKWAYYLQYGYLRRHELAWLRQVKTVYHLSELEGRYLRRRGIQSVSYLETFLPKQPVRAASEAENSKQVFFGDFSNVRNGWFVQQAQREGAVFDVYGRHADKRKIAHYKGAFDSVAQLRAHYAVLFNPVDSRCGIQTKVLEWLLVGGVAEVRPSVYFQFPRSYRVALRRMRPSS